MMFAGAGDALGGGRIRLGIVDGQIDHRRPASGARRFGPLADESLVDEHVQMVTGGVDVQTHLGGEFLESTARMLLHSSQQQYPADLGQPSKIVHSSRHVTTSLRPAR